MLLHFTTKENHEKIKESRNILPKQHLYSGKATGGNINEVSFFKGFDYENKNLVDHFKKVFADGKSTNLSVSNSINIDDIVGLLVDESQLDIEFTEHPKQKRELKHMGLDQRYYDKVGIYVKTKSSIPYSSVVDVI